MNIYFKNARKSNLLNSACLDLYENIRKENIRILVFAIVKEYSQKIQERGLEGYFEKFMTKYEQMKESAVPDPSSQNSGTDNKNMV